MDCFNFKMVSFFIVLITILAASQADVKHLSKAYLPPGITSPNALTQKDVALDSNEELDSDSSEAPQKPMPTPGSSTTTTTPTPSGTGGGLGFLNPGFWSFLQQPNLQALPGAGFQWFLSQVPVVFNRPGLGFLQGFGQGTNTNRQLQFEQMPQFASQAFAGQASPGGLQAPYFVGPNLPQPGVQQPLSPQAAADLQQFDFGLQNHLPSNDEVSTVYGSNGGYRYEKPSTKF